MIYLSDPLNLVIANNPDLDIARENTRIILSYLNDTDADDFDIMVDVGGEIFLAPYNGVSVLDGNLRITPPNNANRATWCLTFQYGSSFATQPDSDIMSIRNFQVEASEKAFLFETINEDTRVEVTDLYNSEVSVCWFGAVAQIGPDITAPDSYLAFQAAINCFRSVDDINFDLNFNVKIPATLADNSFYVLKQPLILNSTVNLLGDGQTYSRILFPDSAGVRIGSQVWTQETQAPFGWYKTKPSAANCSIRNLTIQGRFIGTTVPTYNKHGLIINATTTIENVTIRSFDGDGIFIDSNYNNSETPLACRTWYQNQPGNGSFPRNNTNLSRFSDVKCSGNSFNGIQIIGADTNAMTFESIDVRDNKACGIRDQSLLGNTYIGCHSNNNGNGVNNRSRIIHNNLYYACILDNVGIEPGLNTDWEKYWFQVGTPSSNTPPVYTEWDDSRNYVAAASFYNIGSQDDNTSGTNSCKSVYIGCYSESDTSNINVRFSNSELPAIINVGSISIGGFAGWQSGKIKSNTGFLNNRNGILESQNFMATGSEHLGTLNYPTFSMISPTEKGAIFNNGGFRIRVQTEQLPNGFIDRELNLSWNDDFKSFAINQANKGIAQMFLVKESFDAKPNDFGIRNFVPNGTGGNLNNTVIYPAMRQPLFLKYLNRNYSRILGFTIKSPALEDSDLAPGFSRGDFFFYAPNNPGTSQGNKYKNPLGWRCVANSDSNHTNGEWEILHYFEPAQRSDVQATDPGVLYNQAEVQGILDELRDLKTKLRAAGILLE
jgi:hypothetical protein